MPKTQLRVVFHDKQAWGENETCRDYTTQGMQSSNQSSKNFRSFGPKICSDNKKALKDAAQDLGLAYQLL